MNRLWKMQTKNSKINDWIVRTSVVLTLLLVELCVQFKIEEFDLLSYFGFPIENMTIKSLFQSVIHWLIFTALFFIIYFIICNGYTLYWRQRNKDKLLQGEWLHIHDKEDVRIGVVSIKQNFLELEVEGRNIKPEFNAHKTNWRYIGAELDPEEKTKGIYLLGCYFAKREGENSKQGVHHFGHVVYCDKTGKPLELSGHFGDALKGDHKNMQDASDKTGRIYLFRMSKRIKKQIKYQSVDQFSHEELSKIISNERFKDEPFVKKLKGVIPKNKIQKMRNDLKKHMEGNGDSSVNLQMIEHIIAMVLSYAVFVDGEINDNEVRVFNEITGFDWTKEEMYCARRKESEKIKQEIKVFFDGLTDEYVKGECRKIFSRACRTLVESNDIVVKAERDFVEMIQNL